MGNTVPAFGQLQRAGIKKAPFQEHGVKGQRWHHKKLKKGSTVGVPGVDPVSGKSKHLIGKVVGRDDGKTKVKLDVGEEISVPTQNVIPSRDVGRQMPLFASRKDSKRSQRPIRESSYGSFHEQGQEDAQKKNGQKTKGRVYLVTIIGEGLGNSKDKNYYSGEALKKAPQLFNGAKSYSDHPDAIQEKTLPERSMKDLVGWYSDCFVDTGRDGKARLRGKLHFFPTAKWLTDMIDTIMTDESAKGLFGISINAVGKTRPANMGGEVVNYVEEFQRVDSADVVTEPAARGKFDKMLESKRGSSNRATKSVSKSVMSSHLKESGVPPEKAKEVADSLVAAYNSDNPDEVK